MLMHVTKAADNRFGVICIWVVVEVIDLNLIAQGKSIEQEDAYKDKTEGH
jgi:hypothetical protein